MEHCAAIETPWLTHPFFQTLETCVFGTAPSKMSHPAADVSVKPHRREIMTGTKMMIGRKKTKSTQTLNLTGKMDSKTKHQHCVYKNEPSVCLWMWMTSGSDENLRWSAVKCTSCLNGNCHHVQSQLCLLFPIGAIWTPGINTLILRYGNLLRRLILKRW